MNISPESKPSIQAREDKRWELATDAIGISLLLPVTGGITSAVLIGIRGGRVAEVLLSAVLGMSVTTAAIVLGKEAIYRFTSFDGPLYRLICPTSYADRQVALARFRSDNGDETESFRLPPPFPTEPPLPSGIPNPVHPSPNSLGAEAASNIPQNLL